MEDGRGKISGNNEQVRTESGGTSTTTTSFLTTAYAISFSDFLLVFLLFLLFLILLRKVYRYALKKKDKTKKKKNT